MKQSGKIFDKPVKSDWLFWTWIGLSVLLWIGSFNRVISSGGPNFSFYSIVSGTIDALVSGPLSTFLIPVLPISLIRRLVRKYQAK
jgi:hypothetical protein